MGAQLVNGQGSKGFLVFSGHSLPEADSMMIKDPSDYQARRDRSQTRSRGWCNDDQTRDQSAVERRLPQPCLSAYMLVCGNERGKQILETRLAGPNQEAAHEALVKLETRV